MKAPFYVDELPHFWRRDGNDWILTQGNKIVGRVRPDDAYPQLARFFMIEGKWSGLVSLSRAKDAAVGFLGRIEVMPMEHLAAQ
jgi:hypothetical protein